MPSRCRVPTDSGGRSDDAGGGGPGTDPDTDSGRYLLLIHYLFVTYSLLVRDLFISIMYLFVTYSLLVRDLFITCSRVPNSRTSTVNKPWYRVDLAFLGKSITANNSYICRINEEYVILEKVHHMEY